MKIAVNHNAGHNGERDMMLSSNMVYDLYNGRRKAL